MSSPPAQSSQHVLDRPLRPDTGARVSLSAFSLLFSEMCSRASTVPTRVKDVTEWEDRLAALGREVGRRATPLAAVKYPFNFKQRFNTVESYLNVIADVLWVRWFGKKGRLSKERGSDRYFITDDEPLVTKYIHVPPDYLSPEGTPTINFANFVAGMIQGALDVAPFGSKVAAFHMGQDPQFPNQTLYCIQLDSLVLERERRIKP